MILGLSVEYRHLRKQARNSFSLGRSHLPIHTAFLSNSKMLATRPYLKIKRTFWNNIERNIKNGCQDLPNLDLIQKSPSVSNVRQNIWKLIKTTENLDSAHIHAGNRFKILCAPRAIKTWSEAPNTAVDSNQKEEIGRSRSSRGWIRNIGRTKISIKPSQLVFE